MKKVLILFPIIVLCSLAFFYIYFRSNLNKPYATTSVYNGQTGEWEDVQNLPKITREEIANDSKNNNEDGLSNASILRGYYDHYDEKTGQLVMKSLLPFTQDQQYEEIALKTPPVTTIYCSPSIIVDQKSGQEYKTSSMRFITKNDETMNITKERIIGFNDFIRLSNSTNYLFIQLTQNFNKDGANYIKKLVVIGLCD